jgi:hypothetical protein
MVKGKGEYRPAIQPIAPADEQVAEILSDRQRHFDELRLSREERAKLVKMRRKEEERKQKAKEKWEQSKEMRMSVYLPKILQEKIQAIAQAEGASESQVITFFLFDALDRYERKEIGFWGYKHPSESPRYEWILVHPKDIERVAKVESRNSRKSGWSR